MRHQYGLHPGGAGAREDVPDEFGLGLGVRFDVGVLGGEPAFQLLVLLACGGVEAQVVAQGDLVQALLVVARYICIWWVRPMPLGAWPGFGVSVSLRKKMRPGMPNSPMQT